MRTKYNAMAGPDGGDGGRGGHIILGAVSIFGRCSIFAIIKMCWQRTENPGAEIIARAASGKISS